MLRWIGFVVLILLLLLTAYAGLTDGLSGIHQATGAGQWAATATQLVLWIWKNRPANVNG